MQNAYYFRHAGYNLSPVYAHSEEEARSLLISQHEWCKAPYNSTLLTVQTEDETNQLIALNFE